MQKNGNSAPSQKGIYVNRRVRRKILLAFLVLMAIILVFASLEPVFFPLSNSQKYSDLGIYGPNQTIGGYPTSVPANQSFTLYALILNQEGAAQYYNVLVKLGNQSTHISNSTSANAPVVAQYYAVLNVNQTTMFPMQLSISQVGVRERLIFELWSYHASSLGLNMTYTGDWDAIWLNVTA